MSTKQIYALANQAAADLGDAQVRGAHFVLAIVHPDMTSAASRALRACGVDYQNLIQEIAASKDPSAEEAVGTLPADVGRSVSGDGMRFLGRAEGIAAGMGTNALQPEHYLMSLLWGSMPSDADQALKNLGASRSRILEELSRVGVSLPPGRPPRRIVWGPFRPVSLAEYEEASAQYKREGVHYRMGNKGDQTLLSVAEGWEEA